MCMPVLMSRVMVFSANRRAIGLHAPSALVFFFGFPDEIRVERSSQTLDVLSWGQSASGGRSRFAGRVWYGFVHCRHLSFRCWRG